MKPVLFTVGHSTHKANYFLQLLQSAEVGSVIDVRSIAASRFNPQFTKSSLAPFLEANGIRYFHLHEEFGARQKSEELLDEIGRVDFEKVRASEAFQAGIEFLKKETAAGFTPALMCAEADPLDCHRFSMITVALKHDFHVLHILKDKTIMENSALEKALLQKFRKKLPAPELFDADENAQLKTAFRLVNDKIGYRLG